MHEAILKPSEAQNSLWIRSRVALEIWDKFWQVQLTELSQVLEIVRQKYVKG